MPQTNNQKKKTNIEALINRAQEKIHTYTFILRVLTQQKKKSEL